MLARTRLGLEPLEDRLTPNNRFVVPFDVPADDTTTFHTLSRALTKTGLATGDIVQIEPNATPGTLADANLPAVTNLTIRGHPSFVAKDLPQVVTSNAIGVDAPQSGLKLENLNLLCTNALTFNVNASLLSSHVVYAGAATTDFFTLNGTTAAVVRNNTILNTTGGGANDTLQVNTAAGAANVIAANTLQVFNPVIHVHYVGNNTVTDRVEDNTFIGNENGGGVETTTFMVVIEALNGLTLQRNTFRDGTFTSDPLVLNQGTQNVKILNNVFDFPGANTSNRLLVLGQDSLAGLTTSVTIAYNTFRSPAAGIFVRLAASGTMSVKVEGNDFTTTGQGVRIDSSGTSLANVDLGGGSQGSLGGNNFRFFRTTATSSSGAVVVTAGTSAFGTIQAQNNLWGTTDPETAVFDTAEDASRANITTTGSLTSNAAFVQSLYVRFLKRVGDVTNPADAGFWVNQMNAGMSQGAVANAIIRSQEALGYVVDDLYRTILRRDADAIGRQHHINLLASGWSIEAVQIGLFAGGEYKVRFPGDAAYVASLFNSVLGRSPQGGLQVWVDLLPSLGRSGVANGFVSSVEYRTRAVTNLFFDLLKRPQSNAPTVPQVAEWVNTGLDLLSLRVAFASSAEFYLVG